VDAKKWKTSIKFGGDRTSYAGCIAKKYDVLSLCLSRFGYRLGSHGNAIKQYDFQKNAAFTLEKISGCAPIQIFYVPPGFALGMLTYTDKR